MEKTNKLVEIQVIYAQSLLKYSMELRERSRRTVNFSSRAVILHFSWRKMLIMPQNRTTSTSPGRSFTGDSTTQVSEQRKSGSVLHEEIRAIPVLFLQFVIKQSYINHTVSHKLKVIHGFQTSTDFKKKKKILKKTPKEPNPQLLKVWC